MLPTLEIIKKLAKQKGISLNELENQLGYSKNSLYSLRTQNASTERLHELANYFNVSIDYLLGRTDIPEINKGTYLSGDNNTINGNLSGDVSGNITINNTTNNPVPVTLKNTDDIFESQKDDFLVQKELLEAQKELLKIQREILAELKKSNKNK